MARSSDCAAVFREWSRNQKEEKGTHFDATRPGRTLGLLEDAGCGAAQAKELQRVWQLRSRKPGLLTDFPSGEEEGAGGLESATDCPRCQELGRKDTLVHALSCNKMQQATASLIEKLTAGWSESERTLYERSPPGERRVNLLLRKPTGEGAVSALAGFHEELIRQQILALKTLGREAEAEKTRVFHGFGMKDQ